MCARFAASVAWVPLLVWALLSQSLASNHYTERQLEALATRVQRTYWVAASDGRTPPFLSAPSPGAPAFHAEPEASFEIVELVGRKIKQPYYKVRFASGKEGYLRIETFIEEFNATIVPFDPRSKDGEALAQEGEEEEKRVAWIQSRPWSEEIKQAAIERRPVLGMKTGEVERVLGKPARAVKVKGRKHVAEEQWFYRDGPTLIFTNGLLTRIDPKATKNE